MYRFIAFIISNMIMTTMVFAQHTQGSITRDLNLVMNNYSQVVKMSSDKSLQCSDKVTNRIVKNIDRRIQQAQKSNETLDESLAKELARFDAIKSKQTKMTNWTLKRWWRTRRAYKKMRRNHPSLTKAEFKNKLRASVSREETQKQRNFLIAEMTSAGSIENFLMDIKEKVINCDGTYFENNNKGLILIILFIGLPVLSIISALFAVIFGSFMWALGLFVFAVVMLLAAFIWANVETVIPLEKDDDLDFDIV